MENNAEIKKLLKRAEKARLKMDTACGQIAIILQPFFNQEISVDFQPSDGFVVVWEDGVFNAPNNYTVQRVIDLIKKDPHCFSAQQ